MSYACEYPSRSEPLKLELQAIVDHTVSVPVWELSRNFSYRLSHLSRPFKNSERVKAEIYKPNIINFTTQVPGKLDHFFKSQVIFSRTGAKWFLSSNSEVSSDGQDQISRQSARERQ